MTLASGLSRWQDKPKTNDICPDNFATLKSILEVPFSSPAYPWYSQPLGTVCCCLAHFIEAGASNFIYSAGGGYNV